MNNILRFPSQKRLTSILGDELSSLVEGRSPSELLSLATELRETARAVEALAMLTVDFEERIYAASRGC